MPNVVFAFGEATAWIKPAGLASQALGFIRSYSLARTPVKVENGSASFFSDDLSVESPWVDDDVITIFEAAGPFDFAFIRWLNVDDQRLASVSVTNAELVSAAKRPGTDGEETFEFRFSARALK